MSIIDSEFKFKGAARAIQQLLKTRSRAKKITEDDLVKILEPTGSQDAQSALKESRRQLAYLLNQSNKTGLSLGEIQNILSQALTRKPYWEVRRRLKFSTDFQHIFPNYRLPNCGLAQGQRVEHSFPAELEGIRELASWRNIWRENAVSTAQRPWFPPMLPPRCFQGTQLRFDLLENPPQANTSRREANCSSAIDLEGECCVLVHESQRLVGAATWRWWGFGETLNGVEFGFLVTRGTHRLMGFFDVRPRHSEVTCGPIIKRDTSVEPSGEIDRAIRRISSLGKRQLL